MRGRTMLLDQPLELVFDNRLKREIHDVIGYVTWLSLDDKPYMPVEEVFLFISTRLRHPQPKPEMAKEKVKTAKPKGKTTETETALGSLGKMKGRYAEVLTDFWTGKLQIPDTLNTGIRLLALPLPYYLDDRRRGHCPHRKVHRRTARRVLQRPPERREHGRGQPDRG